jgi:hypothetical protein
MSNSTNINDLPTDPVGGGNSTGNIAFHASEQPAPPGSNQGGGGTVTLDQTTINQIISGLQTASASGATQLPGRDIPRNTDGLTQDVQIKPNYIQPQENNDYIKDNENNDDIINEYNSQMKQSNSLDELYDELQIPLLLGVLYFIFQLPIVRKTLFSYIPMLFHVDGNFNINGYVFTSMLFGTLYYTLSKTMQKMNRF